MTQSKSLFMINESEDCNNTLINSIKTEEQIDYIIDNFNFERVRCAMVALDWQWVCTEGNGMSIPSIQRLKAMARHLLRESIKNKEEVGSGGFHAKYHAPVYGDDDYFVLEFVIASRNSIDYNND
jgi:hypothetical protein